MNLYSMINKNFRSNDIILLSDIYDMQQQIQKSTIRKQVDRLTNSGLLQRIDTGVYTIPSYTITGNLRNVDVNKIFEKKYILNKKDRYGFYSGLTLLNTLGISNQIPNVKEIVTNNESSRKRVVKINNYEVVLRKSIIKITKQNYIYLQFLDMLKYIDEYRDVDYDTAKKVITINFKNKLEYEKLQKYFSYYPSKVAKKFMEYKCYDLFT